MQMKQVLFSLVVILSFAGCGFDDPQAELHALFDADWEFSVQEYPVFATSVGRHEFNARLAAVTEADQARRAEKYKDFLDKLHDIDRAELNREDRVSYDMFARDLEDNIAAYKFKSYLVPFNSDSGFHTGFARLANTMPFRTVKDYENYLARLKQTPAHFGQYIQLLRTGMALGITPPKVVMKGFEWTTHSHVVNHWEKSVFYTPFTNIPANVPEAEHRRLLDVAQKTIMDSVVSAYANLTDFLVKEYIPKCRSTIGASDLPNGREYYAQRVKYYTTLNLSDSEIHQIGLNEVARIRGEMQEIIKQVGFRGNFAAFLKFLRTDSRFYPESSEALLKQASYIAKQMDGKLPSLFKTMPRLPYGVAAVPEHLAPKYTAGRYVGPAYGSTEPGYYWVNTYALKTRPLYTLEALTFHEAVPGHHLQISLAMELENMPRFRQFAYISAFGEGWGLYSEWLGLEAGFYKDPYSNFGRLTYEMWRACRLVVDTGLHAKGWTRRQVLDYLAANTALSMHEITTETDRYISWPGQALSYKMGELKIKELRRTAEKSLGEKFDVREFHDVILRNGAIPLPVLEEEVEAYIASFESAE